MKKRIFAVAALLCAVVCLGGCSSNQGVDVNSIEWVTETYENVSFQVPLVWNRSENLERFVSSSDDIPGTLLVDTFPRSIYDSEIDFIQQFALNASDGSLIDQQQISIAGIRGYYNRVRYFSDGGEAFYMDYYVFIDEDDIYSFEFYNCSEDIQEKVVDSIQIND